MPLYLGHKGNHFTHRPFATALYNLQLLRASHPEELVQQAHKLGYMKLTITDECSYSGLVKAHKTAKACGIKLICGAEFILMKPSYPRIPVRQTVDAGWFYWH